MGEIKNKVIVWGVDGFNTLGLMRELGNHGLDLIFLIKGHKGISASSKYCKKFIETETIEEGYNLLLETYASEPYKPILITPGDDIIIFIDRHKEELEKQFGLDRWYVANVAEDADIDIAYRFGELVPVLCKIPHKEHSDQRSEKYPAYLQYQPFVEFDFHISPQKLSNTRMKHM